jgi:hypothetical protein
VTKFISMIVTNLGTLKVAAKHVLLYKKTDLRSMLENSASATKIAPFCEKFSVTFKTSVKR